MIISVGTTKMITAKTSRIARAVVLSCGDVIVRARCRYGAGQSVALVWRFRDLDGAGMVRRGGVFAFLETAPRHHVISIEHQHRPRLKRSSYWRHRPTIPLQSRGPGTGSTSDTAPHPASQGNTTSRPAAHCVPSMLKDIVIADDATQNTCRHKQPARYPNQARYFSTPR